MSMSRILNVDEEREQRTLFEWARKVRLTDDDVLPGSFVCDYLYAIPNGGSRKQSLRVDTRGKTHRYSTEGRRLQDMGVKAGVSDLHCPLARAGYHGVYIELKKSWHAFTSANDAKAAVTDGQLHWIEKMRRAGHLACVCYGWGEAAELLLPYFNEAPGILEPLYQKLRDRFIGLTRKSVRQTSGA